MTSMPGLSWRSPSLGLVRAERATRLAEEPELTREAERRPKKRASLRSKSLAKRPVVNQASRAESTTEQMSSASMTLPETWTPDWPGVNSFLGKASAWYWTVRSRICWRRAAAFSVMMIGFKDTGRRPGDAGVGY